MTADCGARPSPAPISTWVKISNVPAFVCTGHLVREELQMVFRCGTQRFETRIRGEGATPVWLSFTTLLHHEASNTASTRCSHYQSLMLLAQRLGRRLICRSCIWNCLQMWFWFYSLKSLSRYWAEQCWSFFSAVLEVSQFDKWGFHIQAGFALVIQSIIT